jgi:hypothetical protein
MTNKIFLSFGILFLAIAISAASNGPSGGNDIGWSHYSWKDSLKGSSLFRSKEAFIYDERNRTGACLGQVYATKWAILCCNNKGEVYRPFKKPIPKPLCLGINKDLLFVLDVQFKVYCGIVPEDATGISHFGGKAELELCKFKNETEINNFKKYFNALSEEQKNSIMTCRPEGENQFICGMNDWAFIIEKNSKEVSITKSMSIPTVPPIKKRRTVKNENKGPEKQNLMELIFPILLKITNSCLKFINFFVCLKVQLSGFLKGICNFL